MSQKKETKKSYKKEFFTIFLIVATELIGFGLIIPILPQIANRFETNGVMLGILLASFSLAQFIANPILGALSDKYGRKKILLLSKLGTCLAYILFAFSFNYTGILISRLIDGFTGGNLSVARAYIADITEPKDRSKGMAVIGISFGTGFILGPALGGILFGLFDTHTIPALVAGSLSLLAILFTIAFLKEPKKHAHVEDNTTALLGHTDLLKNKKIWSICLIQFIFMLVFSGYETSFSVFTNNFFGFNEQQNSYVFFYIGILALIIQGGIMRRSNKNINRSIIFGFACTSISFIIISQSQTLALLLSGLALLSLGIGFILSHLPALLSTMAPRGKTGQVMGLYEATGSLSRIIGPLFVYIGFFKLLREAYLVYAGILALLIIIFIALIPSQKVNTQTN
ncbi:hypothetical protein DID77_04135 [Candidatus Marinamargulisbacteria bacterium SCGC AG-439-L15]|nr:hypothetical protein DID77_04135 [Candidatus Marinamargulisbacteria bacterium SCGC AG-439-L15]